MLFTQAQGWMKTHNFSIQKQKERFANMGFAKEFFKIMDADDGGTLDFEELSKPLIALKLS